MTDDARQRLAALSDEQRRVLARRIARRGRRAEAPEGIQRLDRSTNRFQTSFAQQRMWFLDKLFPDGSVYNVSVTRRLRGDLDVEVLHRALDELVSRHEVLRTSFVADDENVVQIIAAPATLEFPVTDLSGLPPAEREESAKRHVKRELGRRFDLSTGPLVRASLLRLGPRDHILMFVLDHITADAWSIDLLERELVTLYEAFLAGAPSPLSPPPIQYADFSVWQRELLQGAVLEAQTEYWKKQLGGLPTLQLPTDRSRSAGASYAGAIESVSVTRKVADGLEKLGREANATLFMTAAAAFGILLNRYSQQEDIAIGTPIANRKHTELEGLVGFLLNMLVLRLDVSGDPTVRELLRRVRQTAMGAYDHQDLPFEKLVAELDLERDLGRNPLFQVFFTLTKAGRGRRTMGGVEMEDVSCGVQTTLFDLEAHVLESSSGLQVSFIYNGDIFEAATIRRMLRHYVLLLEAFAANPYQPLSSLPHLLPEERRQVLTVWNATGEVYPRESLLHELFERQAGGAPDAIACTWGGQRLTYRELDRRANFVAGRLAEFDLKPDSLVGICLERSHDMLAGLLGVLKAGAGYVPLDPGFPPERLRFMVEDAQPRVVLAHRKLRGLLSGCDAELVWMDDLRGEAEDRASIGTTSSHLAYVIYTSGSTGKPKGVQIEHAAVVNFLASMAKSPGLTSADVLLAVTTLSFDISVLELFLPLSVGAEVVIASRDDALDGRRLSALIDSRHVTAMQATPATWRLLLETGWEGRPRLKALCGGEAFPRDLAAELVSRCGSVWNMYGPTETTIWSTTARIRSAEERITVGRPIANTQAYILNSKLDPVPIGVPGELYLGGDGLARGYLDRPELTSERFVPDPFASAAGSRLYRTGDLARYLASGEIECLGRIDQQVKLRGFRIELGEIEAALTAHPAVEEAVAAVREFQAGDQRLVAYYTSREEQLDRDVLRETLSRTLPDYMIPSAYVRLETLPLTPNGKIDRRALPAPTAGRPESNGAPQTEMELRLMQLWKQVLGLRAIGVNDNFFEIGGHSLLAARLFARIESELHVNLPLAALFQAPTVRQLAHLCSGNDTEIVWSSLVPIQPGGTKPPFFCIHPAGGNVLVYRDLATRLGPDQPVYGLQAKGLDGREAFLSRFEDMAAHYIEEIKKIQPTGPYYLGGYCLGGTIAYEMARQLASRGDTVGLVALFETYNIKAIDVRSTIPVLIRHHFQNVTFHVASVAQLGLKEKAKFISEKMKVARRRLLRFLLSPFAERARRERRTGDNGLLHVRLTKVNDQALRAYDPGPYEGKVTLFLPKKRFFYEVDEQYGWRGRLEQHTLPVYPRSMLVEPYTEILASRLKACLDAAYESAGAVSREV